MWKQSTEDRTIALCKPVAFSGDSRRCRSGLYLWVDSSLGCLFYFHTQPSLPALDIGRCCRQATPNLKKERENENRELKLTKKTELTTALAASEFSRPVAEPEQKYGIVLLSFPLALPKMSVILSWHDKPKACFLWWFLWGGWWTFIPATLIAILPGSIQLVVCGQPGTEYLTHSLSLVVVELVKSHVDVKNSRIGMPCFDKVHFWGTK